jgi:hypothetical protein
MKANSKAELLAFVAGLSAEQASRVVTKLLSLADILNIPEGGEKVG